jgi:hypothetical protein
MLRDSILNQEFINYRKHTDKHIRTRFSEKVRKWGIGYIPIVVDSVDPELSLYLATKYENRYTKYGFELILHMDRNITDLLKEIKIEFIRKNHPFQNLTVGLEDGTITTPNDILGDLYKKHRNHDDKILYLLLTPETSIYNYILSILRYLTFSTQNSVRYLTFSTQNSVRYLTFSTQNSVRYLTFSTQNSIKYITDYFT